MESEELNLVQLFKNLYKRKDILWKILSIVTIIAILYTLFNDILMRETSTIIFIDKVDTSMEDTIEGLKISNVSIEIDKNKKTITFATKDLRIDSSIKKINQSVWLVEEKLINIYGIKTYKILQEIKVEPISFLDIAKDIIMFEIVGIFVYIAYAFIITSRTTTNDEYLIFKYTKLKVLGNISEKDNKSSLKKIDIIEDEIEIVKTNIELNKNVKSPKTILLVSAKENIKLEPIINILFKSYKKDNKKVEKISSNDLSKDELYNKINELKTKNDIVLIDGGNISKNYKSLRISNIVDSNIIVAQESKTKLDDIMRIKQCIEDLEGKISGIILS